MVSVSVRWAPAASIFSRLREGLEEILDAAGDTPLHTASRSGRRHSPRSEGVFPCFDSDALPTSAPSELCFAVTMAGYIWHYPLLFLAIRRCSGED